MLLNKPEKGHMPPAVDVVLSCLSVQLALLVASSFEHSGASFSTLGKQLRYLESRSEELRALWNICESDSGLNDRLPSYHLQQVALHSLPKRRPVCWGGIPPRPPSSMRLSKKPPQRPYVHEPAASGECYNLKVVIWSFLVHSRKPECMSFASTNSSHRGASENATMALW